MRYALLIGAILTQVFSELFWDSFAGGAQVYYFGMSVSLLFWGLAYKYKKPQNELIVSVWLFFLAQSCLQELSKLTGILQGWFGDPTHRYWSMEITFGLATVYVTYKLIRK